MKIRLVRLVLPLCLLILTACTTRKPVPTREGTLPTYMDMVKDLNTFPQDLTVYAKKAGNDRNLLSAEEQAQQDARFNKIFFGPWDMTRISIKRQEVQALFGRGPRGYIQGSQRWNETDWKAMRSNADLKRYPSRATPGITLRHTNLRELPTSLPSFSKPTPDPVANPFDNFQYSAMPMGTPLFIAHTSRDGRWHFVETPLAGGWVRAEDVGVVDEAFTRRYRNGSYAALIRDNVNVRTSRGEQPGQVHIGAIFPVVGREGGNLRVLVPVGDADGRASMDTAMLADADAVVKPLPLLPKLIAVIGNEMMGQRYGWGGMFDNRDCSSTMRDLFTPFGIWLPRNSAAQARSGHLESLRDLSPQAKEQIILEKGTPFLSLIWMKGHIGLYVGKYKGQAAMFHNIWGVRVLDKNGEDGRHVIGRCVITSLQPGKELPNLAKGMTLRDRLLGISTVPK